MTVSKDFRSDLERIGRTAVVRVKVLATTDLHAHLFPFDYFADRRDTRVGLAGVAAIVEDIRREHPNVLLLDNGDTLQGSPLGEAALAEIVPSGQPHPMIAAMNAIGYDAATLGNHDFDFGLDALEKAYAHAAFPVVLANATWAADGRAFRPPSVLLKRDFVDEAGALRRLTIGVTGAAPPQVQNWSRANLKGALRMEGILPAVRREARLLREAGADLVIALGHTGLGFGASGDNDENVGAALAAIPDVDAVVAGHTHRIFPGRRSAQPQQIDGLIDGTPVVQPGFWGSHLGVIDLALEQDTSARFAQDVPNPGAPDLALLDRPAARWKLAHAKSHLRVAPENEASARKALREGLRKRPQLRSEMAQSHRRTRAYTARPLGATATPLETFFSRVAPCAATQLVADAQRAAIQPFVAAHPDLAQLPLLSAAAPFKAGGRAGAHFFTDIAPGPLLLRHAADLYLYPNTISVLRVTGADIRMWLERAASSFHQITVDPEAKHPPQQLINHRFASYNIDRIDGLTYAIDLSQPAQTNVEGDEIYLEHTRVRDLAFLNGAPVRDTDVALVVTNSYRAAGGGHFLHLAGTEQVLTATNPVRDTVAEYICRSDGPICPEIRPNWRFAPLGGTTVHLHTGPAALAHTEHAQRLGLRSEGLDPEHGCAVFSMKL